MKTMKEKSIKTKIALAGSINGHNVPNYLFGYLKQTDSTIYI